MVFTLAYPPKTGFLGRIFTTCTPMIRKRVEVKGSLAAVLFLHSVERLSEVKAAGGFEVEWAGGRHGCARVGGGYPYPGGVAI
jgi:hypothetical protein